MSSLFLVLGGDIVAFTTTWDEIRMTVLHKLFLSTGDAVTENDSNRDYLKAMPEEYNAAVMLLSTSNRFITKYFEVPVDGLSGTITVNLRTVVDDLFQLLPNEIYFVHENGSIEKRTGHSIIANDMLILVGETAGTYRIYYHAYPMKATAKTEGATDMQLDPDVAVLVPLYMASQLYKDDDIAIATQYRNEFEAGREELMKERVGNRAGRFKSVTGWW